MKRTSDYQSEYILAWRGSKRIAEGGWRRGQSVAGRPAASCASATASPPTASTACLASLSPIPPLYHLPLSLCYLSCPHPLSTIDRRDVGGRRRTATWREETPSRSEINGDVVVCCMAKINNPHNRVRAAYIRRRALLPLAYSRAHQHAQRDRARAAFSSPRTIISPHADVCTHSRIAPLPLSPVIHRAYRRHRITRRAYASRASPPANALHRATTIARISLIAAHRHLARGSEIAAWRR